MLASNSPSHPVRECSLEVEAGPDTMAAAPHLGIYVRRHHPRSGAILRYANINVYLLF